MGFEILKAKKKKQGPPPSQPQAVAEVQESPKPSSSPASRKLRYERLDEHWSPSTDFPPVTLSPEVEAYGPMALASGRNLAYAMANHRDQLRTARVGCYYGPHSAFSKQPRKEQEELVQDNLSEGRTVVHPMELSAKNWFFEQAAAGYREVQRGAIMVDLRSRSRKVRSLRVVLRYFEEAHWRRAKESDLAVAPFAVLLTGTDQIYLTSFGKVYAVRPDAEPTDIDVFWERNDLPKTVLRLIPPRKV